MLENNIAVFLVTFATQEVVCWKKAKTGEVVLGDENGVEACRYAMVLAREASWQGHISQSARPVIQ
jgi:import inner membrane translocase subunit TIM44